MSIYPSMPQANLLLQSLRSVGYSEETAVADIVDNAISADADKIVINFDWANKCISVVDNGYGMEEAELYKNMQIGSSDPTQMRSSKDLGRFGMGMKTAAFSLGRKVSVITSKNNKISNASWDLDKVEQIGWNLVIDDEGTYDSFLNNFRDHGTAVVISVLDNLVNESDLTKSKKHFYSVIQKVAEHLRLVFHRFISEDGLKIYVNSEQELSAWDPFITKNPATQELADEEVWDPQYRTCTNIQPYVLPHKTKFSSDEEYEEAAGIKGWNRHQGIYIYRNRRLIIYGTWFDIIRKEPAFNLARIKIDISSDADEDWKIDIKKSRASLPIYLRDRIISAIDDCTTRSTKVFNSRGAYSKGPVTPNLDFVWEQTRNNGNYFFRINKKHPLLNSIRAELDDDGRNRLKAYLCLIENFAPFMRNGIVNTLNTGEAKKDDFQRQKDLTDIKSYATVFKRNGFSKEEIIETLEGMASYYYLVDEIEKIVGEIND
ncbi:ATP-binding protein [Schwartzia succinivorans]|jgi:hypothetical protein|uniref:Histidine kinase-, DNA gyrase B-, and HSP90-like ATPase n=1 Tax=Schwartzia succinivorans DSM 10502 TaxID=1123243 RepID=A0A1M4VD21_9FIRM|nr:ATP-binding protein [Schwartzia succinivorans]SHE66778.1 Histidine kinase-, DNA gyrase B-, and HSP90-like ATPase [Schwartzia succinivorans DSM 10502]